ncbi:hypothetical protein MXAZACID_04111 [Acidocella sp. MX-AZ02]|nr:hypothetical protein MXAZACID_04111 [Acidocella sp. MX-AZ02]
MQTVLKQGEAAWRAGNLTAALLHYERAIYLAPGAAEAYLHAGNLQYGFGRYKQALALLETGLGLPCDETERAYGLRVRALTLLQLRRKREALGTAQEAVAIAPESEENHIVLSTVLRALGRFKPAEAALAQAQRLAPDSASVWEGYAQLHKAQRHFKQAQVFADRALRCAPETPELMLLKGQIAFRLNDIATARDMALWALSRNATDLDALGLLAMVRSWQSWFTRPFWWFSTLPNRLHKGAFMFTMLALGSAVAVVQLFLPAWLLQDMPAESTLNQAVMDGAVGYMLLCAAHVGWLIWRDRRQVKLKNY